MSMVLSTSEERVVGLMRQLPPTAVQEMQDFAVFLVARHCGWSYADDALIERAVALMASDPFVLREVHAINDEFTCAETDGLEPYQ